MSEEIANTPPVWGVRQADIDLANKIVGRAEVMTENGEYVVDVNHAAKVIAQEVESYRQPSEAAALRECHEERQAAENYAAGLTVSLLARIAQLRKALQPFAAAADEAEDLHLDNPDLSDDMNVGVLLTLGHLRSARAVFAPDAGDCTSEPEHLCWTVKTTAYMRSADRNDTYHAVHFQNAPSKTESGTTHRMIFPVLVVPSYVEGPEQLARKVAAILNEHWPKGGAA